MTDALRDTGTLTRYVPVDGSGSALREAADALDAAELRHELDDAGDSVIVSAVSENENGYTWRVHVHVADPDTALDLMRRRGTARNVTVTSLAAEPR